MSNSPQNVPVLRLLRRRLPLDHDLRLGPDKDEHVHSSPIFKKNIFSILIHLADPTSPSGGPEGGSCGSTTRSEDREGGPSPTELTAETRKTYAAEDLWE